MAKTPVATSGEGNSNSKLCWRLMAANASKQIGPQTVASAGVAVRMWVAAWFALGTEVSSIATGAWGQHVAREIAHYAYAIRFAKSFLIEAATLGGRTGCVDAGFQHRGYRGPQRRHKDTG